MLLFFPGKRDLLFILIFEIIKELKRRPNYVAHHKKKKKKNRTGISCRARTGPSSQKKLEQKRGRVSCGVR